MQAYTGFAYVYDTFMDNVPYDEWAQYLISLLKEYGINDGLLLELGCGTGNMTRRLSKAGYDMIGVDLSEDMLEMAREKGAQEGFAYDQILYLNQDMRNFELYGTVAAVVSICDSMNYITEESDLKKVFQLVNNYLDPQGIFIFDMNTVHKYKDIIGNTTIAENREDMSLIWENYYFEKEQINQYDITIYKKVEWDSPEEETPLYERLTETHYQKAYSLDTIVSLLCEAGMEFVAAYSVGTHDMVDDACERMYIIAREKQQEHKYYIKNEE